MNSQLIQLYFEMKITCRQKNMFKIWIRFYLHTFKKYFYLDSIFINLLQSSYINEILSVLCSSIQDILKLISIECIEIFNIPAFYWIIER